MPIVVVTPTYPMQIRPGAFASPLERVIIDKLARDRIVTVTLGLCTERADHLGVTVVASFTLVNVAPGELQCAIRLQPSNGLGQ